MDFADYKIDLCFTAVYYYLHNHPNNNAVEIDERCKMKEALQHAVKIYPEISNVTWDEFMNNETMYRAFHTIFFKAFCKWRERNWFGMSDAMIKDVESMMFVCDCDLPNKGSYKHLEYPSYNNHLYPVSHENQVDILQDHVFFENTEFMEKMTSFFP